MQDQDKTRFGHKRYAATANLADVGLFLDLLKALGKKLDRLLDEKNFQLIAGSGPRLALPSRIRTRVRSVLAPRQRVPSWVCYGSDDSTVIDGVRTSGDE